MLMKLRVLAVVLAVAFALVAADGDNPVSHYEYGRNGCSTSTVNGLSTQLIAMQNCLTPGLFTSWEGSPGLTANSAAVFPYLQKPATDALIRAGASTSIAVNSGLRTLPQQYLLYKWGQRGRCNIGLAASPGNSNHNQGLAVDVSNTDSARSTLQANSFRWYGSKDRVHYTFSGSGTQNVKSSSVKAFQIIWNQNNPWDVIAEDGDYGPQTERRLRQSPSGGWTDYEVNCDELASVNASAITGSVGSAAVVGASVAGVMYYRSRQERKTGDSDAKDPESGEKSGFASGASATDKVSSGSKRSKGSKGSFGATTPAGAAMMAMRTASVGSRGSGSGRRSSSGRRSTGGSRHSSSGRRRGSSTRSSGSRGGAGGDEAARRAGRRRTTEDRGLKLADDA